ncbi:MAG: helical backbone metal receptor [Bacteroidales bacterium]
MALVFTDHSREEIHLPDYPQKIISLCPSITETLVKLGLTDRITGRTCYCYRPEQQVKDIPVIGGASDPDMDLIKQQHPDLIIAVKEENNRSHIEQLREHYAVYVFDINTYSDAIDMIIQLGELTGKQNEAVQMSDDIDKAFARIPQLEQPLVFLYLVWNDPLMAAGKRTYINSILTSHGFTNCLSQFVQRYVTLNIEVFKKLNFDIAFLPTEPYHFTEDDRQDILSFYPETDVRLVDGEAFSWYGFRMLDSASYLADFINNLNEKKK